MHTIKKSGEEEILSQLIKIATNAGVYVYKMAEGCPEKYFFSTGYCVAWQEQKAFHGLNFGVYENKFYQICKSLKLL